MKIKLLLIMLLVTFLAATMPPSAQASRPWKGTSRSGVKPKPVPAVEGYDPVAKLKQTKAQPRPAGLSMGRPAQTTDEEPEADGVSLLTHLDTGITEEEEADDFHERFGWFKDNIRNGRKLFADNQAQLPALLTDLEKLDGELAQAEKNVTTLPDSLGAGSDAEDLDYGKQWTAESAQAFAAARTDTAAALKDIQVWKARKQELEKQADKMDADVDEGVKAVDAGGGSDVNAWMDKMGAWVNRMNEETSSYEQSAKDLSDQISMWKERAREARGEMERAKELEADWRHKERA